MEARETLVNSIQSAIREYREKTGDKTPLQIEIEWIEVLSFPGDINYYPGLITIRFQEEYYC